MKRMKILALVLTLVMLFSIAACANEGAQKTTAPAETAATAQTAATEETAEAEKVLCTALIKTEDGTTVVEIDLNELKEGATMLDAFKSDAYKGEFDADVEEGQYVMLNGLKGLTPDGTKNEYIAVYSTDTTTAGIVDKDSEYTLTEEIGGTTYYTTMVGVADLTLKEGESYLFQIATF
ncbi:MAG: hypothetical protein II776_05950 [Clostridia bacterium]|nr:hypothetical protein [Clostridia bacterium]